MDVKIIKKRNRVILIDKSNNMAFLSIPAKTFAGEYLEKYITPKPISNP